MFKRYKENKIFNLYKLLTNSDFKGNYDDTYSVELLFTLLNIDLIVNGNDEIEMNKEEMIDLGKEIIRIYESDDNQFSYYSIRNWTEAILEYMYKENKDYSYILKRNTYDLRNEVSRYLVV